LTLIAFGIKNNCIGSRAPSLSGANHPGMIIWLTSFPKNTLTRFLQSLAERFQLLYKYSQNRPRELVLFFILCPLITQVLNSINH
jgi:hypothetical protein